MPPQDESADVDNFHEVCYCEYYPYLIGALYVYKGLLVVFGLFLAYESRNVKYYYINDSRFVSIAMYIVVILVGIGAPLSLVLAVHYFTDAAYALAIFMVVGSSLSCMLILFIPKVCPPSLPLGFSLYPPPPLSLCSLAHSTLISAFFSHFLLFSTLKGTTPTPYGCILSLISSAL